MLKNKRLVVIYLAVVMLSHGLVLWYSDDIKRIFFVQNALHSNEYHSRYQVQVGVLLPDEVLLHDDTLNSNLAKSFLSEKVDWYFLGESRLPKFTGLDGTGFGFRAITTREAILE